MQHPYAACARCPVHRRVEAARSAAYRRLALSILEADVQTLVHSLPRRRVSALAARPSPAHSRQRIAA